MMVVNYHVAALVVLLVVVVEIDCQSTCTPPCYKCAAGMPSMYYVCTWGTWSLARCSSGTECLKTTGCGVTCAVARRRGLIGAENEASNRHKTGNCRLPRCFSPHHGTPGGLTKGDIPMMVYLTFDDAVTSKALNKGYGSLFTSGYRNPNGCPIGATFMVTDVGGTDYNLVSQLYQMGHEIGSHSISHKTPLNWWATASKQDYRLEIAGQRERISKMARIPLREVRGMRSPFLQLGGNNQFDMLQEEGFIYDSSMVSHTNPPSWPFTLHDPSNIGGEICRSWQNPCPTKAYAPLWELPLNFLLCSGQMKSMADECHPTTERATLQYLRDNFARFYDAPTRPPFGIHMHAPWFLSWPHNLDAMHTFLREILTLRDVWVVTGHQVILWTQNPTPLKELDNFEPFQCK